jgi:hypothetical protein
MENGESQKRVSDGQGRVRVHKPDRSQVLMRVECDEDLIPQQHQARII